MTGERDDERTFSSLERDTLSERLADLMKRVAGNGFAEAEIGVDLLVDLHRTLFEGVRDHAGRVRRPGWGQEALTFGPHRSTLRDRVPGELERVFREARSLIDRIEANPGAENFEEAAFFCAVKLHAECIRIHPFEDGNGRSSRLLANIVLRRLGLRPVSVEATKDEYLATLSAFFLDGDLEPLIDLFLRLATNHSAGRALEAP